MCLSSHASLETFPSNTQCDFVNHLPMPVTNKEGKSFYIRLKSIGIANNDTGWSSYLKIHIYEVVEQREGVNYTHFAGGFSYPPKLSLGKDYGFHTFRQAAHLPIRFHELNKIQISITNEIGEKPPLPSAPATLVWVELTDMAPEDQFTITCLSNQPSLYPNNNLVQFTTPLPTEMSVAGYEVALQQLVYPPYMTEASVAEIQVGRYNWKYRLDLLEGGLHEFVARVQGSLSKSTYKQELVFDIHEGKAFFARRKTTLSKARGGITITPSLNFIKACGQLHKVQGEITLMPGETLIFEGQANPRLGVAHPVAMLECDIISPNVRCGERSQLLQCVPVFRNKDYTDNRLYEPPELAFHPVAEVPINSIDFKFLEPDGRLRQFSPDNTDDYIAITLLFKHRTQ